MKKLLILLALLVLVSCKAFPVAPEDEKQVQKVQKEHDQGGIN